MEIQKELLPEPALAFLETWQQGGTLLLAGPPGTGKTVTVAYLLGQIYQAGDVEVEQMPTGEFAPSWQAPQMRFSKIRDLYAAVFDRNRSPLQACLRAGILALDDWGSAYEHAWPLAELDGLVDDRWDRELPTIVTTNLPGSREQGAQFSFEATAERAFSRLCGRPGPGLVLLDRKDLRR
jgi:DNA replication protein DnaC